MFVRQLPNINLLRQDSEHLFLSCVSDMATPTQAIWGGLKKT